MPVFQISIYKGRSEKERAAICDAIQQSIKCCLSIVHGNFHHRVFEFDGVDMKIPPGQSTKHVLVEMDLFPGRDESTKLNLFQDMCKRLEDLGVPQGDIMIIYREPNLENWYIGGKTGRQIAKP